MTPRVNGVRYSAGRPRDETVVRYRLKQPPQFVAVRIGHGAVPEWLTDAGGSSATGPQGRLEVQTPSGSVAAEPGDWVLKGPRGNLHVVSDPVFRQHFERVPLHGQTAARARRQKRVRMLVREGRTTREIASALGVPMGMVVRDRADLGCPAKRGESRRLQPESDPRIQRMMTMFRDGASGREMAVDIGVSPSTIYRWVHRLGFERRARRLLTPANTEFLAMIHRAGRDGLAVPEIVARWGSNRHAVNKHAKRLMAKGLVECRTGLSANRRRCYVWSVTAKGREACCGASADRPWCVRESAGES